MTEVTPENLALILGEMDENSFAAIQATGATLQDIIDAKDLADGKTDIAGFGEQVISGPTQEVLTILLGYPRTDPERMQHALLDPASVFASPAHIVADATLNRAQKVEILRRWEYDASEISVAEDEGMPARDGELLRQIFIALHALVDDIDTERTPPTKQGGLDRQSVKPKP